MREFKGELKEERRAEGFVCQSGEEGGPEEVKRSFVKGEALPAFQQQPGGPGGGFKRVKSR